MLTTRQNMRPVDLRRLADAIEDQQREQPDTYVESIVTAHDAVMERYDTYTQMERASD